jgi:SagB-type dehydrogenase family enzyme
MITLPHEMSRGRLSLEEALERRRSVRRYSDQTISLEGLSRLLWAAGGVTQARAGLRAVPSAGALYPLEHYLMANRIEGVEPGIYHYNSDGHALEMLHRADFFGNAFSLAALSQPAIDQAAAVLVVAGVFERTRAKYRARAERYVFIEAGHAGQNVYLEATALGLGVCAVGAFLDEEMNHLFGLDGTDAAVIYLLAIGQPLGNISQFPSLR